MAAAAWMTTDEPRGVNVLGTGLTIDTPVAKYSTGSEVAVCPELSVAVNEKKYVPGWGGVQPTDCAMVSLFVAGTFTAVPISSPLT